MESLDPREEIPHDIETGQIYADDRTGDELLLIFADNGAALLRDRDRNHRLMRRTDFDKDVAYGRYKLDPDAEPFTEVQPSGEHTIPFEELDNIGEQGAQNLREAGYVTINDVAQASDSDLLDVSWVGEKGVASIRAYYQ